MGTEAILCAGVVQRGRPMTGPPGGGHETDSGFRGSQEQQPRAFDEGRRVRVIGEDDLLIEVCSDERAARYLNAPNAEVKKRTDGSIRMIRLRAMGDDRSHLGEGHGRSTRTTERVRNDWGGLVGGDLNVNHKATCTTWGAPAVPVRSGKAGARD